MLLDRVFKYLSTAVFMHLSKLLYICLCCFHSAVQNSLAEQVEQEKQKRLETETQYNDAKISEATLRTTVADLESQILNLDNTKVHDDFRLCRVES